MRKRRRWVIIVLATAVALLACWRFVLLPVWHRACGNEEIVFYGRVIDQAGNPVRGKKVRFEGFYSDRIEIGFAMNLRPQKKWERTVTTDEKGNFKLSGVYGYSVRFGPSESGADRYDLIAVGVARDDDPAFGVRLDDASSRSQLPETPQRRITYRINP